MKSIITARSVTKFFTKKTEPVLNKLNLDIKEGEFTIIMGSSGSGKSTLLYLLSGLDSSNNGEIIFNGKNISLMNEKERAIARRNSMGFVFQNFNMISHLTILENIAITGALCFKTKKKAIEESKKILDKMGLLELANRTPEEVSGGELQRASIARALINSPEIIFADEPTGNLNSQNSIMILDELENLSDQGHTILMVTHELKSACRGDKVIFIKDGVVKDSFVLKDIPRDKREDSLYSWLVGLGW